MAVLGVAIVDKILAIFKEAPFVHRHISGNLLHPRLARMGRDPGHFHSAALQMDEEQYVIGDQAGTVSTSTEKKSVPASTAK